MELDEVAAFVRVVQCGSMNKAAQELSVPRSTVSRRLQRLEESLGVRLIRRTTRKMSLTSEGAAFFERVSPAIATIRDASRTVHELGKTPRGTVRVSLPIDMGFTTLPSVLARFLAKYPLVKLDADCSNRFVDLVQEGFDAALRAGVLADSSLIARRIGTSDLWLVASPSYLAAAGTPATPAELTQHACLAMRASNMNALWKLQNGTGDAVEVPIEPRVSASDFGFLYKIALAGAGIALLPALLAKEELARGELVRVLPEWFFAGTPLHIVSPPGRHTTAKVRALQDFLAEELKSIAFFSPELAARKNPPAVKKKKKKKKLSAARAARPAAGDR